VKAGLRGGGGQYGDKRKEQEVIDKRSKTDDQSPVS
jgi:hypothetical protein